MLLLQEKNADLLRDSHVCADSRRILAAFCGDFTGVRSDLAGARGDLSSVRGDLANVRGFLADARLDPVLAHRGRLTGRGLLTVEPRHLVDEFRNLASVRGVPGTARDSFENFAVAFATHDRH